ncbi:Putrescine oxidase [Afipia felis]|uniref:Tryptophan 2-monooxygenase n=1 Tax=Afipia felis TaxID=1035 RepID=A0A090N8F1_AFIFE|nr:MULTISPECIES: NAD(P)/FAD-dependent oxidoreductase [Afipia]EFI53614.1 amine oxidase [Afipia sp. 1NLS2]RTL73633.1 MAG: FAD-dependent oxidoreductase [Bradyrhizobiaceae bacterium]CEG10013.1 Putrescine oxidase [Afipia felis]
MKLTRRELMAAAALLAVTTPRRAFAAGLPREVDVAIIGAGAAGIAAARKVAAAGRSVLMLEASSRLGGRCVTDATTFGVPFDRGARWLYSSFNPLVGLARLERMEVTQAARGQRIRVGRRNARAGETEDFLALMVRVNRAMGEAVRGKGDLAVAQALPQDLREWRGTVEFQFGPLTNGGQLDRISTADTLSFAPRDPAMVCRQGLGTFMTHLAGQLPVALETPVTSVRWNGRDAELETRSGTLSARAVIVTASVNVLNAGKIKFTPELPKRQAEALSHLTLGSYDHIALDLPGNPLGLGRDEVFIEQSSGPRTGLLLANTGGSSLCQVDVGGAFGRELSAQGEAAMVDFAQTWLRDLFGGDVQKAVTRSSVTRWNAEPYVMGAMSVASPGGQPARRILAEPLGPLFFAGEALHEQLGGTVGGAWISGERAADAALRKVTSGKAERPAAAKGGKRAPRQKHHQAPAHPAPSGGMRWPGFGR